MIREYIELVVKTLSCRQTQEACGLVLPNYGKWDMMALNRLKGIYESVMESRKMSMFCIRHAVNLRHHQPITGMG